MKRNGKITTTVLIVLSLIFSAYVCVANAGEQGVKFGQVSYKYAENNRVIVSASFEDYALADSGVVICLLYDAMGDLCSVSFDDMSDFSEGYTKTTDVDFEKCRLLLWESKESLKPLCPESRISVSDVTKRTFNVTFDTAECDSINETIPQGDMIYGAKFNLPSAKSLSKEGYVLTGFTVNGTSKAFGEEITVGEEDITILPVFSKLVTYKIEYYRQKNTLDGYTLYTTNSSKTALEGSLITLNTGTLPSYYGFVFSEDNEGNVLSATQTSSGVTLKVYYDRLIVTVECYRHNPYATDYYLYETKTVTAGYVDSEVSVDDITIPEYPNYSYNATAAGSVLSGIITRSGLTLKVYYDLDVDEAAQAQVIYRLNRILTDLDSIGFTKNERKVLSVVVSTINSTLADAESGAYIYMEGYVKEYYGDQVDNARTMAEGLKETGEFDAFKSKLGQLRANDVEYLAKTMLGIEDINAWI